MKAKSKSVATLKDKDRERRTPISQPSRSRTPLNVRFVYGPNSSIPAPNILRRAPNLDPTYLTTHLDNWDVTNHPYSNLVQGLPPGSVSAFTVTLTADLGGGCGPPRELRSTEHITQYGEQPISGFQLKGSSSLPERDDPLETNSQTLQSRSPTPITDSPAHDLITITDTDEPLPLMSGGLILQGTLGDVRAPASDEPASSTPDIHLLDETVPTCVWSGYLESNQNRLSVEGPQNPCPTPVDPDNSLSAILGPPAEISLEALDELMSLLQEVQETENIEPSVSGSLPSIRLPPAPLPAVPQYFANTPLNSFPAPHTPYPQPMPQFMTPPTAPPPGISLPFPQFPTAPQFNPAIQPYYPQYMLQASFAPPLYPSQTQNTLSTPLHGQFPLLNAPIPGYHYPVNPYAPYHPQLPFLQDPLNLANQLHPPPIHTPTAPVHNDIWSTVFEHAQNIRRQNTANRKKRKRSASNRGNVAAEAEADQFICPFCYRIFLRTNSYALHLNAHRKAALNVIQTLRTDAASTTITGQTSGNASSSSSTRNETRSPPIDIDEPRPTRARRPSGAPKRPRVEGKKRTRQRRSATGNSVNSEPPPPEVTTVTEPTEELCIPTPTFSGPITPLATPPRSACRSTNAMWYQPETPIARERTSTSSSLSRWHEELFGSDDQ